MADATRKTPAFITHSQNPSISTNGTCLQGVLNTSYGEILEKFGLPTISDQYKVDALWCIEFSDGIIATIYNYKDGICYLGEDGLPVDNIRDWQVGGYDPRALAYIQAILC